MKRKSRALLCIAAVFVWFAGTTGLAASEGPAAEEPAWEETGPQTENDYPATGGYTREEPDLTEMPVPVHALVPQYDGTLDITPILFSSDVIQMKLEALEEIYYPGLPWDRYQNYGGGTGCLAFAYKVSDLVFGEGMTYRKIYNYTYDDIHVGDILRESEPVGHTVVILEKYSDRVLLLEGNYSYPPYYYYTIRWRREQTRQQILNDYLVLFTRYPKSLTGDVDGDKCIGTMDAVRVLQSCIGYAVGMDTAAADINGDGAWNTADAAHLLVLDAAKQDGLFMRITTE